MQPHVRPIVVFCERHTCTTWTCWIGLEVRAPDCTVNSSQFLSFLALIGFCKCWPPLAISAIAASTGQYHWVCVITCFAAFSHFRSFRNCLSSLSLWVHWLTWLGLFYIIFLIMLPIPLSHFSILLCCNLELVSPRTVVKTQIVFSQITEHSIITQSCPLKVKVLAY